MESGVIEDEPEGFTEFDAEFKTQKAEIPGDVRLIIEKLAYQVKVVGLSVEEACLLKNIDTDWLDNIITKYPVIDRILRQKELEFRVALMKPLIAKAKVDDKMAQYLLELRTPKDKKKSSSDPEEDASMLALAISHIQENGDSSPLVRRESGFAVLAKGPSAKDLMGKIKALLPSSHLA